MSASAKAALIVAALNLLSCAIVPDSADEAALRERPDKPQVHADLVQTMLSQGQSYAAMAHIEELESRKGSDSDMLRWLRATAQYKLSDFVESEKNYRALLDTRYAGQAWHGLGLIAAQRNLAESVHYFNRAVGARPTDAQVRNDLGYTLMLAGRLTEARHHLATATELNPNAVQAQNNLILSFFVDGQDRKAMQFARSFDLGQEQVRQIRAESAVMRRLMAARAAEFNDISAAAMATSNKEKPAYESQNTVRDERTLPGLYRQRR
ncbi:MAG: tetratricopeptide repeat protein [Oceanococcus sp.]